MSTGLYNSESQLMRGKERCNLPLAVVWVFLLVCVVTVVNWGKMLLPAEWLTALLVVTGFWAAVASVVPVLPWPNAFLAAGLAVFIGGLMEALSVVTGLPLGMREFAPGTGPTVFGLMPWWLPLVWGIFALSARGSARLILYRTRQNRFHGYRVIALATVLAGATSIGLEIFATRSGTIWESNGMPFTHQAFLFLLHFLIQVGMTPLLIDKFPGHRPPNFLPLWVWGAVGLLLAAGVAQSAVGR